MKKENILKKNKDFEKILNSNNSVRNNNYIIYYCNNNINKNRYGISVGKKIGNAVTRNYYKRIIRNICDKNNFLYSNTKDYIIILRKGSIELSYKELLDSFNYLLEKINKEKEKNNEEKN